MRPLLKRVKALEVKLTPEEFKAKFLYFATHGKNGVKREPIGINFMNDDYLLMIDETLEQLKERVEALADSNRNHLMRYIYE